MSNEIKVIANDSDLVLRIESELEYDSLFKLIKERENKKRELFQQDFISSLEEDINRWYSVAEAGKILGGGETNPS